MSIDWRVVPIERWPLEPTPERQRKAHPFRRQVRGRRHDQMVSGVDWTKTVELLERELRQLRAKNVLMQLEVDESAIRLDGKLRANAKPRAPGVVVSFDSRWGPLSYPCDTYTDWQANVRAIALAMEALRKVDRYGVTKGGEQYRGWKRLPAETVGGAEQLLAEYAGLTVAQVREDVKRAFRVAALNTHPDRTGDDGALFIKVAEAARVLGANEEGV